MISNSLKSFFCLSIWLDVEVFEDLGFVVIGSDEQDTTYLVKVSWWKVLEVEVLLTQ